MKPTPWGVVFDSQNKEPIDPAYVTLYDRWGRKAASAITDIDGRFGFLVPPGLYRLSVEKTNYRFPSQVVFPKGRDTTYGPVYNGGWVRIGSPGSALAINLPMDPLKEDWNQVHKQNFLVFGHRHWLSRVASFFRRLFIRRDTAVLIDRVTGQPLAFAFVRLAYPGTGVEVAKRVTDNRGRFFCLVAPGVYEVAVDKPITPGLYVKVRVPGVIEVKEGLVTGVIRV